MLLYLPYTLTLIAIIGVSMILPGVASETLYQAAKGWGLVSVALVIIAFALKISRSRAHSPAFNHLLHRILLSLAFAGIITAGFALGYRPVETFYDEVDISEPWVSGYVFRGVAEGPLRQGEKYWVTTMALTEIYYTPPVRSKKIEESQARDGIEKVIAPERERVGTGEAEKTGAQRLVYQDSFHLLSQRSSRRMQVKLKIRAEDIAATERFATKVTSGTVLTIDPYYHLSTATIKNPSYKNYLIHKQQVGTIYVYAKDLETTAASPILQALLKTPQTLRTWVRGNLVRFVRTDRPLWADNGIIGILLPGAEKILTTGVGEEVAEAASAASASTLLPPLQATSPDTSLQAGAGDSITSAEKASPQAQVIPASTALSLTLLTGDRSVLASSVVESFRQSGTYHVLAVSGMHTGILITVFLLLTGLLPLRRLQSRGVVIFLLLPLYVLLVGPRVSVLRSAFMVGVAFFALLRDRRLPLEVCWALVLILMILANPHYIYDISFQLSFSAVLGVIMAIKLLRVIETRMPKSKAAPRRQITRWILATLIISLSCQVFTMPFILYYFSTVPVLAPVYNLFIPPLIMVSLTGSLFIAVFPLPLFSSLLGTGIAWLNEGILQSLEFLLRYDPQWGITPSGLHTMFATLGLMDKHFGEDSLSERKMLSLLMAGTLLVSIALVRMIYARVRHL